MKRRRLDRDKRMAAVYRSLYGMAQQQVQSTL